MALLQKSERLKKELGLLDVYFIATGATLSSGFFLLPGLAAASAGSALPIAYLVAGVFLLPGVMSMAELTTAMPRAGSIYYFLDRSMGPLMGTIGGGLVVFGSLWHAYYAKSRVKRRGAIYHVFERLGRLGYEGIDWELRTILKEKGLRRDDRFDRTVARSLIIDLKGASDFELVSVQPLGEPGSRLSQ